MELAREFDFAVALELNEGVFVNRLTPTVEQIAGIVEHPVPPVVDIEEMFERKECCQLCFYFDEEAEQKVMPLLVFPQHAGILYLLMLMLQGQVRQPASRYLPITTGLKFLK